VVEALAVDLHEAGIPVVIDVRSDALGYEQSMRNIAARAKHGGASCLLEIHFNAEPTRKRAGTEVLYWGAYDPEDTGRRSHSAAGRTLAQTLATRIDDTIRSHLPTRASPRAIAQDRSWSASAVGPDGRPVPAGAPLYALSLPACPAVIVESHYGATRADHAAADRALADGSLTAAMVVGIRAWLGR
jgi:N-acetylmuramoyl-L-alanine amidase